MIYDVIIVGAGASGLFAAASFENKINGLILNKSNVPGQKLLMSGAGQCNITKSGDIKDFLNHYGNNGKKIRKPLYKFSNQALVSFIESRGIPTYEREDGKIFPVSLKSKDILEMLLSEASKNGFTLKNKQSVSNFVFSINEKTYILNTESGDSYKCHNLIIATGGCSYTSTGSDGSMFKILSSLGIDIIACRPALVPLFVENYKFNQLSGISFPNASVTIDSHQYNGGLLLTHDNFSGPAVLDASRYAENGKVLKINYFSGVNAFDFLNSLKTSVVSNQRQISTVIKDYMDKNGESIPKRFVDSVCLICGINPSAKASSISAKNVKSIVQKLTSDEYKISGTSGYTFAMCTRGGVSLNWIDLGTFECKKYPGLYIVGEALDIDGDTGGYNLQFAFSSGFISAKCITKNLTWL